MPCDTYADALVYFCQTIHEEGFIRYRQLALAGTGMQLGTAYRKQFCSCLLGTSSIDKEVRGQKWSTELEMQIRPRPLQAPPSMRKGGHSLQTSHQPLQAPANIRKGSHSLQSQPLFWFSNGWPPLIMRGGACSSWGFTCMFSKVAQVVCCFLSS